MINAFDPALGIEWPIPKEQAIVSEKDAGHPLLANITPVEL
jgi:dTDP-4-dehydrorhamnose 3,5-epimerase